MKLQSILSGVLISIPVYAEGYYPEPITEDQPWSIMASMGYGQYQWNSPQHQTYLGRLALGNEMLLTGEYAWGLELGIQNGHKMQLSLPKETLALLKWLPVNTSLSPMIDLLVTAKSDPLIGSAFYAQLKGGIAYRYWEVENRMINDLSLLAGEIQAGLGYPITTLANLNLFYQGVFGDDQHFKINTYLKTGRLSNIPILHAFLLGFSINI